LAFGVKSIKLVAAEILASSTASLVEFYFKLITMSCIVVILKCDDTLY